ncbi:glycoside hydrolase family 95 protein [Spirosoma sp. HMF3257]|uniref:Glycoside hydrolase family 95 protein n=1 Tax=Spirosoma telluris TaxID=2183553 RepID=A0A327NK33_9BACT|nr:glycoside hydrolase family 95 protein [Spirosoma telluris]RAI75153.1 glycoside hydrolase family 95 protein [Spirosoma telluris]
MLFGNIRTEHLQFNDQSLMTGTTQKMGYYQPFGDVFVDLDSAGPIRNYRRELNLQNAVHTVQYEANGVQFERTAFASFPDQVQVLHFSANKPGQLTGTIRLSDAHQAPVRAEDGKLIATGTLENGMTHEAQVRVVAKGGSVSVTPVGIRINKATAVTVLLAAGTSFVNDESRNFVGPHPHQRLNNQLDKAVKKSIDQLKLAHVNDYQSLFGRVRLQLGASGTEAAQATPDRLTAYAQGKNDPALEALLFQFGRYLLIGSSRPGGLPANLQGLWNHEVKPAWYSQYTTNINIEMNYWLAEQTNLPECHMPLFDWVENLARVQKKSPDPALKTDKGWIIYSTNNIMGGTSGWHIHRPGSAWLSQHFWEHYAFGGDKTFLKDRAYPLLKTVTEYWVSHLVVGKNGRLITPDGWSPEHGPGRNEKDVSDYPGVSYDQQIVYDLFTNYLDAARVLGVDKEYCMKIETMRNQLLGPQIGKWGQLQEWMDDVDDPEDHHRHNSHLFAVHPGRQIRPLSTPDLAKAALVSLNARGEKSVGWSSAWKINLYARLRDAGRAHALVQRLVTPRDLTKTAYSDDGGSYPNLLGVGPPFQIDSNFGYTAGITEMLLQSHTGEIELLPALPPVWSEGEVSGLRARGGVTVAMRWKNGVLRQAQLMADRTGMVTIRYGQLVKQIRLIAGRTINVNQVLQ